MVYTDYSCKLNPNVNVSTRKKQTLGSYPNSTKVRPKRLWSALQLMRLMTRDRSHLWYFRIDRHCQLDSTLGEREKPERRTAFGRRRLHGDETNLRMKRWNNKNSLSLIYLHRLFTLTLRQIPLHHLCYENFYQLKRRRFIVYRPRLSLFHFINTSKKRRTIWTTITTKEKEKELKRKTDLFSIIIGKLTD